MTWGEGYGFVVRERRMSAAGTKKTIRRLIGQKMLVPVPSPCIDKAVDLQAGPRLLEAIPKAVNRWHPVILKALDEGVARLSPRAIAAVAVRPSDGAILAMSTRPTFDPNRFIGGIPAAYYTQLLSDPRRPLLNKALQGRYPPGSTWKLATAVTALEQGIIKMDDRMPVPCTGGYQYGNRFFKCHLARGHGSLALAGAIEQSCDVYFYQLALKMHLPQLVAGGVRLGSGGRSGIDLPNDSRPEYPSAPVAEYFNRKYGPRGWAGDGPALNLAIGQGENAQTVVNVARFYTALANGGEAAQPRVVHGEPVKARLFTLDSATLAGLRGALAGVVSRGTAASARSGRRLLTRSRPARRHPADA